MKLLEKYVLSEFVKLLVIAVLAFITLFILVDLFENMDNMMKYKVPPLAGVVFFMYKVPFIIGQIAPVAVLVSVLLSLGILAKNGEITAMKAGGVRLLRIISPLLAAGVVISIAVILINESVTPTALRKVDSFRKEWFGVQGSTFGKEGLWLRTNRGIFNIREVDLTNDRLHGVMFFQVDKPFNVRRRVNSRTVKWKDGRWVAESATVWTFSATGQADKEEVEGLTLEGLVKPEEMANVENIQKNMSFRELKHYIRTLEADGYEASKYKIDLYDKVSFPLVNFIMVLVGVPFALKTGRHGGIAMGVGLSIVIAFSYWVVFAITKSLGQSGMVPPLVAAFFPNVLFFAIGTLMFGYVKQ